MNYRLKSSVPGHRPTHMYAAIALIIVVCGVLLRVFFPDVTTRAVLSIAAPVWKGGQRAEGVGQMAEGVFKSKQTLIRENEALSARVEDLERELASHRNLITENDELRALLGLSEDERTVVAQVLSVPPHSPYDTLVLEIGKGPEPQVGDPIFSGSSILIGEVSELHGKRVFGTLYSSAGRETVAVIERNNVSHPVVGTGGGNFEITVPREVDIEVGDRLMMPGITRKIVAEVRQIDIPPTDSFKKVLLRSPVNIFQLKWVTIGKQ